MALSATATKLANLVNPEVIADLVDKKLVNAVKFAPLAKVDTTLVGVPGGTIKVPYYKYIGDAEAVAEGSDIAIKQLVETSDDVVISKIGNGVQLTDEAVLSGYGDPIGQAVDQLVKSIASKLDNDLLAKLAAMDASASQNVYTSTATAVTAADIANALALFGEDIDGDKAILVGASTYAALRTSKDWLPASDIAADIMLKGAVGEVQGCQVVVTNRITDGNVYIVKPGALGIFLKRDTNVETDRDIINKSNVITVDKHYAVALIDDSKAIKITHA